MLVFFLDLVSLVPRLKYRVVLGWLLIVLVVLKSFSFLGWWGVFFQCYWC